MENNSLLPLLAPFSLLNIIIKPILLKCKSELIILLPKTLRRPSIFVNAKVHPVAYRAFHDIATPLTSYPTTLSLAYSTPTPLASGSFLNTPGIGPSSGPLHLLLFLLRLPFPPDICVALSFTPFKFFLNITFSTRPPWSRLPPSTPYSFFLLYFSSYLFIYYTSHLFYSSSIYHY